MDKKIVLLIHSSEEYLDSRKKEIEKDWGVTLLKITDVSQTDFYRGPSLFVIEEPAHYCILLKDKTSIKLLENYLKNNTLPEYTLLLTTESTGIKDLSNKIEELGGLVKKETGNLLSQLHLSNEIKEYLSKLDPVYVEKIYSTINSYSEKELGKLTIEEIQSWLNPDEKVSPVWEIIDKILLGQSTIGLSNWDKHKENIVIFPFLVYMKKTVLTLYKVSTLGFSHPESKALMGKREWFFKKCKISTDKLEDILKEVLILENGIKGGSPIEIADQVSCTLLNITHILEKSPNKRVTVR